MHKYSWIWLNAARMNYLCPTWVLIKSCYIKILACQHPFAFHLEANVYHGWINQAVYYCSWLLHDACTLYACCHHAVHHFALNILSINTDGFQTNVKILLLTLNLVYLQPCTFKIIVHLTYFYTLIRNTEIINNMWL